MLPADVRYLSAARVVAATLAAESGFDIDDLDRLRLGVNELLTIMIESVSPSDRIRLEVRSTGAPPAVAAIEVSGATEHHTAPDVTPSVDALAERILDAVADRYRLDEQGFELRVVAAGTAPIRER